MANTARKGTKKERDVMKILEGYGYDVCRTYRKPLFIKGRMITLENDFFGCLDLIGKNDEHTLYVQVTDPPHYAVHTKKFEGQKWPKCDSVQIWIWYGGARKINKTFTKERRYVLAQIYKVYIMHTITKEFEYKFMVDKDGTHIGPFDEDYQAYIKKKKGGIEVYDNQGDKANRDRDSRHKQRSLSDTEQDQYAEEAQEREM